MNIFKSKFFISSAIAVVAISATAAVIWPRVFKADVSLLPDPKETTTNPFSNGTFDPSGSYSGSLSLSAEPSEIATPTSDKSIDLKATFSGQLYPVGTDYHCMIWVSTNPGSTFPGSPNPTAIFSPNWSYRIVDKAITIGSESVSSTDYTKECSDIWEVNSESAVGTYYAYAMLFDQNSVGPFYTDNTTIKVGNDISPINASLEIDFNGVSNDLAYNANSADPVKINVFLDLGEFFTPNIYKVTVLAYKDGLESKTPHAVNSTDWQELGSHTYTDLSVVSLDWKPSAASPRGYRQIVAQVSKNDQNFKDVTGWINVQNGSLSISAASQTVLNTAGVTVSVSATGLNGKNFQWYVDGTPKMGGVSDSNRAITSDNFTTSISWDTQYTATGRAVIISAKAFDSAGAYTESVSSFCIEVYTATKAATGACGGYSPNDPSTPPVVSPTSTDVSAASLAAIVKEFLGSSFKATSIQGLGDFILKDWAPLLLVIFAFVSLVIGGFFYLTAGGDPAKTEKGKKTILYVVVGLVIAAFAVWIIATVIAQLRGAGLTG